jgi:hypothetical protein
MLLSLKDCIPFVESKLSIIPVPDWTHADVISKDTIILSFDEIYIDDINGNETKVEPHTGEEIETLKNSFAESVDLKEFPPAVRYRPGCDKPYELVYGFGRCEALRELKQKVWFFTLLEGSDDAIEDVQAMENEARPKRINKEVDMRKFLTNKVEEGKIGNTEKDIRDKFRKIYSNRDKTVMNRVVQQVMEALNTPQPFILYTSTPKIQDWLNNHCSDSYAIEGEYDNKRKMVGVHIKEGYQYRAVIAAIQRYSKTGEKTYVIGHFSAPTKKATLNAKRKQFIQEFNNIRTALQFCGLNIWPIEVMGFLPQDKENENLKKLVKVPSII